MWKRWTFIVSCFSAAFALKVGTRRNGSDGAKLKTTSRICSMRRSLVFNKTSEFHGRQCFFPQKKLGFQLLTSRKCIHSCFLFSMGFLEFVFRISFLVATVVAEACCVSFVSHRSPGSTAFAYSCQERLCTGKKQANSTCWIRWNTGMTTNRDDEMLWVFYFFTLGFTGSYF